MREQFNELAGLLPGLVRGVEVLTLWFSAEESDFIRFNQGLVRQPTHVRQATLTVSLIDGKRRASRSQTLALQPASDREVLKRLVQQLRADLPDTPEDPYLLYNREPVDTERREPLDLPTPAQVIEEVTAAARGKDLVGFYAGGPLCKGFANSLGQRNWHELANFNLGWCLYHARDKAVKTQYAGARWDSGVFGRKMAFASQQLERLAQPAEELAPGDHRVLFAPAATAELLGTLAWGGFGTKSLRTKQSTLLELHEGRRRLHPAVTLAEHTAEGLAPAFQADGFVRPARVDLIRGGQGGDTLVSPRTAQEYGLSTNGASESEGPHSMHLAPGTLPEADMLKALDNGVYVGNLWYLNYSDRQHARMTGMTRFACFRVRNGQIAAPLNVMRFDDSAYRFLGEELEALTDEAVLMPDDNSYGERSTDSVRAPGLLVRKFRFTL